MIDGYPLISQNEKMRLTLLLFIAIGVACVASMPIDTEETVQSDTSIVNDSQDADKRIEVPKKQAKKLQGSILIEIYWARLAVK